MSKKCTPLWREAHLEVKMYKTPQPRTTFGSCDVEKVHAVVARSTFGSQNAQNTATSDHFWKLRCRKSALGVRSTFGGSEVEFRKSARRCGAKHISKSKCAKHQGFGPLLEAEMWSFEKGTGEVENWCVGLEAVSSVLAQRGLNVPVRDQNSCTARGGNGSAGCSW